MDGIVEVDWVYEGWTVTFLQSVLYTWIFKMDEKCCKLQYRKAIPECQVNAILFARRAWAVARKKLHSFVCRERNV